MSVNDGQRVRASVANAAFMSRTTDHNTTAVVDLDNTTDANSGAQVPNLQRAVNENYDTSGTFYADANAKIYATNNVVTDGDNQKTAIEKFDVQVQTNIDDIDDRVVAPASSTDNAVARYDGTTGKLVQDSGVLIDDSDNITGVNDLTVDGDLTVNGTTTTINTDTLAVEDANITVNVGGNQATADDVAGLTVEMSDATDGSIIYDKDASSFFRIGELGSEVEVADISTAQIFTNKTLTSPTLNGPAMDQTFGSATNTNRLSLPQENSTNLDALTDVAGLLAYDTDLETIVVNDGTQWNEISGTGGGGIGLNYLAENSKDTIDAEKQGVGDWAVYSDLAQDSPSNGIPGAANVTITRTTTGSELLRGEGTFKFSKDAADRQGEGFSVDIAIDPVDQAKLLDFSFDVDATDANYAEGDLGCFVYDITNAVVIRPTLIDIGRLTGKFTTRFQTASNSTSYRLIVHTRTTNALAYDVFFDDFRCGPAVLNTGSPVTDPVDVTVNGAWTTNTTYSAKVTRVGKWGFFDVNVALTGAPNSATFTVTLPYTIDTAFLTNTAANESVLGEAQMFESGVRSWPGLVRYSGPSEVKVTHAESTSGGSLTEAAPFTFGASDRVNLKFWAPLTGWGSSVTMSSIDDARPVFVHYQSTGGSSIATNTIVDFNAKVSDSHGAVTTGASWQFEAPKKGRYNIATKIQSQSANVAEGNIGRVSLFKNGSNFQILHVDEATDANATHTWSPHGSITIELEQGDTIDIRGTFQPTTNLATANSENFITITSVDTPQSIAETETIAASYKQTSAQSVSDTGTIIFNVKEYDTHGAYNSSTGVYTVPEPGKYLVSVATNTSPVAATAGNRYGNKINQAGSVTTSKLGQQDLADSTTSRNYSATTTAIFDCQQGDTLTVTWTENIPAVSLNGTGDENFVEIARIK